MNNEKWLEFKEKKSKDVLVSNLNRIIIQIKNIPKCEKISAKDALEFYKSLDIGPGNEICVGWSYVPLELEHVENELWSWIRNDGAILQTVRVGETLLQEGPTENELWMITYGEPMAASNLVICVLREELKAKKVDEIGVFCDLSTTDIIKNMGFEYPSSFDGKHERTRLTLFEKHLD